MKLLLLSLLSGCTPYVGYTHLSDPRIDNDGYDLICLGGETKHRCSLDTAICKDVRGGEMVKVDARCKL